MWKTVDVVVVGVDVVDVGVVDVGVVVVGVAEVVRCSRALEKVEGESE